MVQPVSEIGPVKKVHDNKLEVAEMRMRRSTLGNTRRYRIRNDTIGEMNGVPRDLEESSIKTISMVQTYGTMSIMEG